MTSNLRRILLWATSILVVGIVAVLLLRRGAPPESSDPEISTEGHFVSDSLGVTLLLPPSDGWRLRRDPPIPGGSYVTALHESGRSTVRLFIAPATQSTTLPEVIDRREAQFAAYFGVPDIQELVAQVIRDETGEIQGFPTKQWHAVTYDIGFEDQGAARVVFMWSATVRPQHVYECVAMTLVPADPLPEQLELSSQLVEDAAFVMQSFRIR